MHLSTRTVLSISLALSLFSGCAPQPKPAEKAVVIDSTLPVLSLNGYISDITSAAFEWKPVDDPRVTGYYVYRTTPGTENQKLQRIATVDSRFATHFVDHDLKPNTEYLYRFSTITKEGTESVGSETLTVMTQPMIAPVSFFQSVGNMPRSAKLLWRPHPNTRISGYDIERLNVNEQTWNKVATITGRLNAEFIDKELKDGQVYYYRIKAHTQDNLVTDASETTKVVTKPLPPQIANITTTDNLPRAIAIKWDSSTISDLSHYNIYRASSPSGRFDYHVKLETNSFTDKIEEDGKTYYYKVTAVDKDGLESAMNTVSVQGSSLSKPQTPIAFDGRLSGERVQLSWVNEDPRTVSYTVIKTTKINWLKREVVEINNISIPSFIDTDIKPDTAYSYEVVSVDANGIRSLATKAIDITYEAKK